MRTHKIAIVNNADLNNPEHFVVASQRVSRAIRKARIMKQQNGHVILFQYNSRTNNHYPISLKKVGLPEWVKKSNGMNGTFINLNEVIKKGD